MCIVRRRRWCSEPVNIVFLVNGSEASPMGIRARSFAAHVGPDLTIRTGYRSADRVRSIAYFYKLLREVRPRVCYVFDIAYSGVIAAALYKTTSPSCRIVIDTGDAVYELAKSVGARGRVAMALTWLLEQAALRLADRIVVRSRFHAEWLAELGFEATVVPDGVDLEAFLPNADTTELRKRYGLDGFTTVGVLGSIVWNKKWEMCYGWELIEAMRLLKNDPVKGVIIGDGDGLPWLRARCKEYGLEDRIVFLGRIPYAELPNYVRMMDICLSTQTNDLPGRVRTTGKLPVYLASDRYVLATRVGEAARVLPEAMLLDYEATKDISYPERLSKRIRSLLHGGPLPGTRELAVHFDYGLLAGTFKQVLTGWAA
jgi:glycosyltransferase involved in cell wall biosynthesis